MRGAGRENIRREPSSNGKLNDSRQLREQPIGFERAEPEPIGTAGAGLPRRPRHDRRGGRLRRQLDRPAGLPQV